MSRAVLVTGGAGYVGAHVCKALLNCGFEPVVFDNLARGHAEFVRWGPLEIGDLRDTPLLEDVMRRHKPVAVLHFAALAYVGESLQQPLEYYENNVGGSVSLLKAIAGHTDINKLVFSSTCATYGCPSTTPIPETHPQQPINPYGWSKLFVERILRDAEGAVGIHSMTLRYFNAAGADTNLEIGEWHDPETHLIPLVLRAALKDGTIPITIFGTDYPTVDGTCVRDYIHVEDLASAHVLVLQALLDGAPSDTFNVANERGHSVREVIATAKRVTGEDIVVESGPRRSGDPPELVGDATKIREKYGWRPERSQLEEIMRDAWGWQRKCSTAHGDSTSFPRFETRRGVSKCGEH